MTTGEDVSLPPLLELMGEKPKQATQSAIPEEKNDSKTPPYPELDFGKKTPEVKGDDRPIAKLFKRGTDNKPITRKIDFGDPEKWGNVYQTPAICDSIKGIVELNETSQNGNYNGPIVLELKNGEKFFADGFRDEQICYELDTNLSLLETKAQYWK